MGKKIKIYESEIKRATRRKLMENYLDEDYEMRDTYSKRDFKPTPREKGIEKVFGKYGDDMDPAVIRYMRKNPDAILRRMAKQYPDIYMRHTPVQPDYRDYPDPIDVSDQYDEEGYYIGMDEATQMNVYDDASNLTNDLETDKVKRGETVGVKDNKGVVRTITVNESTEKLFKRFLNKK